MQSTTPTTALSPLEAFGTFAYWPDELDWSFQLIRLVGESYAGGADFSEVHSVARTLPVGNVDAWHAGFTRLAEQLDTQAATALIDGHLVSARAAWFRASNYFRASSFFHTLDDERVPKAIAARRRTFQAAAALNDLPIAAVEIPYEDSSLPGYVISPGHPRRPTPAVIVFGGLDAISEEMYFCIGRALAERGYTVLAMDGPGQGEALRRGIPTRHDYEVPVAAAVDFLQARDDVDGERIALVGQSLGGYYASRAAAFERRLKATVVWGACYGFETRKAEEAGYFRGRMLQQLLILFGASDVEQLHARASRMTLQGVAEQIACPTLILHAETDSKIPFADAQRTFEEIRHDDKRLIVYRTGEPGCTHCQLDSLPIAQHDICNYLDEQLAA